MRPGRAASSAAECTNEPQRGGGGGWRWAEAGGKGRDGRVERERCRFSNGGCYWAQWAAGNPGDAISSPLTLVRWLGHTAGGPPVVTREPVEFKSKGKSH